MMTYRKFLSRTAFAALIIATASVAQGEPMTEVDLVTLKRLASPTASPDGKLVVYQLRTTDLEANKGKTDLYILNITAPGATPQPFASIATANEHDPAFSPDGQFVYYLSNATGSDQVYRYAINNPAAMPQQISTFKTDIAGFKLSPNGKLITLWGDIARACSDFDCTGDTVKGLKSSGDTSRPGPGSGKHYDKLFVRHWDAWETPGNYSRIFAFGLNADGTLYGGHPLDAQMIKPNAAEKPILVGDSPSKPSGGSEEIAWDANNQTIYYALRIADRNEPLSTNLDIYSSDQNYDSATNLTADNKATDTLPAPSPDGKYLAYAAMARPGYEADRQVVMVRNLTSGKTTALTQDWDRSVDSIAWALDSKSLIVTAQEVLDKPAFLIDLKGKITRLTADGSVSATIPMAKGALLYTLNSIHAPDDLYLRDAKGKVTQLTQVNPELAMGFAGKTIDSVNLQRFSFTGANGDTVWGQITTPMKMYGPVPTLFVVHGGPQGSFGNGWSFRWNPKVMAAQGYAVVTIDFHGSTGYGQKFTDSITKNWGGWPLGDLKLGLAAAQKTNANVDVKNACALGASYGGYMMNWIAGQWNDGFKCLVNHAGVFDLRAMAFETEELWFDEYDQGGPWWKRTDAERWNPVNHVTKWKTPMLVIAGEKDFRIPYSQSLAAFTALQRQDIASELLIFPDENHWVLKPQNSIQWHRTVFAWVKRHLKPGEAAD